MTQFFQDHPQYANPVARNKKIYENWENCTLDSESAFEGVHNGFRVEVKFSFWSEGNTTNIVTVRQLQSAEGSLIPQLAPITTFTYVTQKVTGNLPAIKIVPNNLGSQLSAVFDFKNQKISHRFYHYLIRSNDATACKKLLSNPFLAAVLKNKELVKFRSYKNKTRLVFKKVFEEKQDIQDLLLFLETMPILDGI